MTAVTTTEARPLGNTRNVALSILWFVLTIGIYSFFWVYRTQDELKRHTGEGLGGALGLVVYIVCVFFGWVAIAIPGVLISSEIERLYQRDGRTPEHSGLWGLWLLLPLVGNFVWFIPTQGALNRYWESKGVPPA